MRTVLLLLTLMLSPLTLAQADEAAAKNGIRALERLPIQDSGRIKPFRTFARETLMLVHGRSSFRPEARPGDGDADKQSSANRTRPPLEVVMTWFLAPQFWDQQPFVELRLAAIKDALKLEKTRDRFSPTELFSNERLGLVFQDLTAFRETKQKMTPYYQAVQRLENQLGLYQAVKDGSVLRFVPPKPQAEPAAADKGAMKEPERWRSVAELDGELKSDFATVAKAFIRALPGVDSPVTSESLPSLLDAVNRFKERASVENPALYPDGRDIDLEVHYEQLHPFRVAWVLYLLAAILTGFAWAGGGRKLFVRGGWALAIAAVSVHTYGFLLRMFLTGRPPVSNMYETVIWVSWGVMLFSMFFEAKQRRHFVLLAGAAVAALCNIVADAAPSVLDGSLQPLEPVLRSNLWLTVHVLTITISYSAFFLAWSLGNIGLGLIIRGEQPSGPRIESIAVSIYRSIQVGVVLLAAGIILGGVWADYSWGRFWGWDPKETWALIALLGYIAILHARLSGMLRQLGLVVGVVIAFNLIIMSWYGVNFVLGAGLHSYGFGAGGVEYMTGFVLLDLAFVGYAVAAHRARSGAVR